MITMDFETFRQEVVKRLPEHLPDRFRHWRLQQDPVYKVNLCLHGMTLIPSKEYQSQSESVIMPSLYFEDFYELMRQGHGLEEVVGLIARVFMDAKPPKELTQYPWQPLDFQQNMVFQLINREKNQELLKRIPHRKFLDMAVIYRLLIMKETETQLETVGTIINYPLMQSMHLTEKQIYKLAKRQTQRLLPSKLTEVGPGLYLISNEKCFLGATAMIYKKEIAKLAETLEEDLYILPSSMHEILLMPISRVPASVAETMMQSVNRSVVEPEDWLSDEIYIYERETKKIKKA